MTAQIVVTGRLGKTPETRATKTGSPMAFASMAANLDREDLSRATWFRLVAFGSTANRLAAAVKGDTVTVVGSLQSSTWTGVDGQERSALEIVIDQLLSARQPAKRSDGDGEKPGRSAHNQPPAEKGPEAGPGEGSEGFDDIPF